jgi:hypothetical protein
VLIASCDVRHTRQNEGNIRDMIGTLVIFSLLPGTKIAANAFGK